MNEVDADVDFGAERIDSDLADCETGWYAASDFADRDDYLTSGDPVENAAAVADFPAAAAGYVLGLAVT